MKITQEMIEPFRKTFEWVGKDGLKNTTTIGDAIVTAHNIGMLKGCAYCCFGTLVGLGLIVLIEHLQSKNKVQSNNIEN